ncbi:MAG: S8 family peptidase [Solirubrobacterales bacterium]
MSDRRELETWVYGPPSRRRYTQDSPVMPEIWFRFGEAPQERQDLLLTPHQRRSAAELLASLRSALERQGVLDEEDGALGLASNEGYVSAYLSFAELVRCVVPLAPWWRELWPPEGVGAGGFRATLARRLEAGALEPGSEEKTPRFRGDWAAWYLTLVGGIAVGAGRGHGEGRRPPDPRSLVVAGLDFLGDLEPPEPEGPAPLWSVNLNRLARTALAKSRLAVKADAAERVFSVSCEPLRWAIVDTGIDAAHPAFRRRDPQGTPTPGEWPQQTRVLATYDFTRLRPAVAGREHGGPDVDERLGELRERLRRGLPIDWEALKPALAVEHDSGYRPPGPDHGTHIAGIVGGDWRAGEEGMPALEDLVGICPDIGLYDLRVFDELGNGEEFAVIAALQFVRYLNSLSDQREIHGANLSLSIDHDLANYAVGRTPVCEECERLAASGVFVAAAAGNEGQTAFETRDGRRQHGFRTVAITDPGNADAVTTVGSTHRRNPHTYGVSYFSSRGKTGDGRAKPDLVAPGEKIAAPTPAGDYQVKDGTSQATAHVSGVAALLMARHPELVGRPARVKQILAATATDLGREPDFQGAGLVDALRALQAV